MWGQLAKVPYTEPGAIPATHIFILLNLITLRLSGLIRTKFMRKLPKIAPFSKDISVGYGQLVYSATQ